MSPEDIVSEIEDLIADGYVSADQRGQVIGYVEDIITDLDKWRAFAVAVARLTASPGAEDYADHTDVDDLPALLDVVRARAEAAEAALATARAEGAAAERAAIVADLRSLAAAEDLCAAEAEMSENVGRGRINGGAIVRRGAAALRAAAGVIEGRRPVEGA
jgi:hypothetical protein